MKKPLGRVKIGLLIITALVMVGVGILGGVGTYSNLSGRYGGETALGALGAGEGATAVLALVLLVTTVFGRPAPRVVRLGLWALPAAAGIMGATAADGMGQTIVYALTPMAITASAESVAYLARLAVVHQEGRDVEAEARAAAVVRDLAYHQARAAAHPSKGARKRSVRKSWRLARKVGTGDTTLGTDLLGVQRVRLTQGADIALERMFTPGMSATVPALLTASADGTPALLPAPADDATSPRAHESTTRPDANGYPAQNSSDQQEQSKSIRPALTLVRTQGKRAKSLAADVRQMVKDGVDDVRVITDALATRHGRQADDPKFKATVARSVRAARRAAEKDAADAPAPAQAGPYL
ncbi:hypothetical protein CFC35_41920 [Streptomyces sp. FBKL.4005]|uniref:hypothetical protein n=1 Tax=Streptomyces sp. FBKL.4005 TaxID=2015515 RepID=UPI000B964A58|nr:hypothetical protein [Streptomyces sp. FBKL.4005]OYP09977.1 hypothetical protein CFC35_41920 [Streptomyces sp. FBKL.4005]